mmetsp:Transcript_13074/g.29662  ORF Transcript_13074/g.29662 Transcript_13074/m.29662 type:complete len:550 (-) Transcript_13074:154-1803(-)
MMNICIWINRDMDLKVEKRMARGTTVAMLKEQLARDGIMQVVSPDDFVLIRPGHTTKVLRDTQVLNNEMKDLEFADPPDRSSSAGKSNVVRAVQPKASSMVGRWLYSGKYQYHITEGKWGELFYNEQLSTGTRICGPLQWKDGGWYEVELKSLHDDKVVGMMSLCMKEPGEIISQFKSVNKQEWGSKMNALLVVPVSWTPQEQKPEWFEVVYSKVLVKKAPNKDGASWGLVSQGTKLQVRVSRAVDARGWEWVELMPVQLQRSFGDDASNVGSRGFVLIDGTRLDLGQLLRGPLPEEEWPSEVLPEGSVDPGEVPRLDEVVLSKAVPFLPAVPEKLVELARGFVLKGWAHVEKLGITRDVLKRVRPEVDRMEWEMTPGQAKGDDFSFRTDRKVFFDTSSERLREDIPGLNQLVDTLQGLVSLLGRVLERSPVGLHLQGRCRPMLASYGPHGRYLPHVDNGDGDGRVLTMVYYLNPDWLEMLGGHLRLYPEAERRSVSLGLSDDESMVEMLPMEDSCALFRADRMVHEVRPAERRRVALTLWFLGECDGV